MQAKLESELADARSKASAVPVFSLSSGEELEVGLEERLSSRGEPMAAVGLGHR